uniref:Uncharacterized protein n=1 Tax=Setaria italica TaxID=4555 RepID=K3ZYP0_SETIT
MILEVPNLMAARNSVLDGLQLECLQGISVLGGCRSEFYFELMVLFGNVWWLLFCICCLMILFDAMCVSETMASFLMFF